MNEISIIKTNFTQLYKAKMLVDLFEVFLNIITWGGKHIIMTKKMKIKMINRKTSIKLIPTLQN